jgi:hypothetical protein
MTRKRANVRPLDREDVERREDEVGYVGIVGGFFDAGRFD